MAIGRLARGLETYQERYSHIRLQRTEGILEMALHTEGNSLRWGADVHEELGFCFADIAEDPGNEVVILTGTGVDFCVESEHGSFGPLTASTWLRIQEEGVRLLRNLLAIPVPVIGAVNGRAHIHAELPLLANIVVAAETASFRDAGHFPSGAVPGDGVHVAWPALIGTTRASYFLLTGQTIAADEAKVLGIVNEIVASDALMPRARALAAEIAEQSRATRLHTRTLLTRRMRRLMEEELGHGLALEGLGILRAMQG